MVVVVDNFEVVNLVEAASVERAAALALVRRVVVVALFSSLASMLLAERTRAARR